VLNEMFGVERLEEIRGVGFLAAPDVPTVRVSDERTANSLNRKLAFALYREANPCAWQWRLEHCAKALADSALLVSVLVECFHFHGTCSM
jgi:hypothetical protein